MAFIKLKKLIEQHYKWMHFIVNFFIFIMVASCTLGISIPIYNFLVEKQISTSRTAAQGLSIYISNIEDNIKNTAYQLSQDNNFILNLQNVLLKKDESVGVFRRYLNEFITFNNIDFFELVDINGKVYFDLNANPERENKPINNEIVYKNLNYSNQVVSIDLINNTIYILSSIYSFDKQGNPISIILIGRSINDEMISEWAEKTNSEILVYNNKTQSSLFPLKENLKEITYDILLKRKNIIETSNNTYAFDKLSKENLNSNSYISFYVLQSINDFKNSIKNIIIKVSGIVLPILILTFSMIFILGKLMYTLSIQIYKKNTLLEKNNRSLSESKDALALRIKDAEYINKTFNELFKIQDIKELEKYISDSIKSIIPDIIIDIQFKSNKNINKLLNENENKLLWEEKFLSDLSPENHGSFKCFGLRELTSRELTLLDTFYLTTLMRFENILQIEKQIQERIFANEILIAKNLHNSIMPQRYPVSTLFDISGYYEAATTLGGDFLSCYYHEKQQLIRAHIGDVTGHGIPSAIMSTAVMAQVEYFEKEPEKQDKTSILKLFTNLNSIICRLGKKQYAMTFMTIEIDLVNKKVSVISAGHNTPYLFSPNLLGNSSQEKVKPITISPLLSHGNPFGLKDHYEFSKETIQTYYFTENSTLFLYTDGITEATNSSGKDYGVRSIKKIISNSNSLKSAEIIKEIMQNFGDFTQFSPLLDDITMLIIKLN